MKSIDGLYSGLKELVGKILKASGGEAMGFAINAILVASVSSKKGWDVSPLIQLLPFTLLVGKGTYCNTPELNDVNVKGKNSEHNGKDKTSEIKKK